VPIEISQIITAVRAKADHREAVRAQVRRHSPQHLLLGPLGDEQHDVARHDSSVERPWVSMQ
jgi:hypothetical protein